MRTIPTIIVAGVIAAACAHQSPDIECIDNETCNRFLGGQCLVYAPTGRQWCSYPDDTCPSDRRWSDLDVGDGLEGECVELRIDAGADASGDATLVVLTTSAGALEPPFDPAVTEYQLDLLIAEDAVAFTPTAAAADTTITVDGVVVESGTASSSLELSPGERDVNIVATAGDGTVITYQVHVRHGVDAIASLELSYLGGPITNELDPPLDPTVTSYDISVGLWVQRVQVTVQPVVGGTTVTVFSGAVDPGVPSLPIALNLGLTSIPIEVTAASGESRTYTLDVTRAASVLQQAYAKASNTGESDSFGNRVALWGNTLAVGAPAEDSAAVGVDGGQADNSASGSGAVYVFTRVGQDWEQQSYLKASNTGAGDGFGQALAIWGDTLAVGAVGEDSSATGVDGNAADNSAGGSGAVYVFTRGDGEWTQQAYVKATNTDALDAFGTSVALWENTLAVGAVQEDSAATGIDGDGADDSAASSGAVYIYVRSGNVWTPQAYVKAANTDAGDRFGNAVALWGQTLAVGAYFEDDGAADAGAAYVFTRNGASWSQEAFLKASNPGGSDYFGSAIALSADTLAVGAPDEDSAATTIGGNQSDNTATGAGAVYVFRRLGAAWSQQAYVKASNTDPGDNFGTSVAIWGDILAVGATDESSGAVGLGGNQTDDTVSQAGAAYVFTRLSTSWSQQAYVKASNTDAGDQFGGAISLWGDTLAVGAGGERSGAVGVGGNQLDDSLLASGAVYVLR